MKVKNGSAVLLNVLAGPCNYQNVVTSFRIVAHSISNNKMISFRSLTEFFSLNLFNFDKEIKRAKVKKGKFSRWTKYFLGILSLDRIKNCKKNLS